MTILYLRVTQLTLEISNIFIAYLHYINSKYYWCFRKDRVIIEKQCEQTLALLNCIVICISIIRLYADCIKITY